MKRNLSALAALTLSLCALDAAAQTRLSRYMAPASPEDGLRLARPVVLEHGKLGALLTFDYADDPLVLELESGLADTETARLVDQQLQAQAWVAYGLFDRLILSAGVDVSMMMLGDEFDDPASGTTWAPADGAGLGDARVAVRYVPLGTAEDLASVGIDLQASAPLARGANSGQSLSGERGATVHPQLLFELRPGALRFTTNFGVLVRADSQVLGTPIGDELTFGAGAAARLPGQLRAFDVLAEVYGATATSDVLARGSTPVEALIGARWQMSEHFRLTVGGGPGVQRGIGSPDMRALASLGFVAMPELDGDHDGIADDVDGCITQPEDLDGFQDDDGCPDPDNDGDQVLDAMDRCAGEAEDLDGFQDHDGCPDNDNDGDGIADSADQCALEAEDLDGDRDEDGCPDLDALDADGDGLSGADDRCPEETEDVDQFQDEDGCPDPDNDGDGLSDADDACPLVPGRAADKGCAAVVLEKSPLRIDERIEFARGEAVILDRSLGLLEQIRALLEQHPEVRSIAVEGHTDSTGSREFNQELSERRAANVIEWLVRHGVSPARLSAWACGNTRPLTDGSTLDGQQKNRRVELHLVDPAPEVPHDTRGCRRVPTR